MAMLVTAASVSDPAGARLLFAWLGGACKKLHLLWVDGTYRGQLVEWVTRHMRFVLRVTLRPEGWKALYCSHGGGWSNVRWRGSTSDAA